MISWFIVTIWTLIILVLFEAKLARCALHKSTWVSFKRESLPDSAHYYWYVPVLDAEEAKVGNKTFFSVIWIVGDKEVPTESKLEEMFQGGDSIPCNDIVEDAFVG